ncbi:DUF499 domain-containing protein (plasmid) [Deinococcus psychrotolerans]|uniref:DUF499 domain-containing protein n=1 Tax=Deinococcus psychrotolerans TaxID=2489213 RepID=A0A3G8YLL2_9DEIO|nr:DUF499 domain-containing protein [Deinococcus psychrotolerans]AZI45167.1 DUF499 domain-containing protein [Deinococcus psychrotolerans]
MSNTSTVSLSLASLIKPRSSVFDTQRRDTVLDLIDLMENRIDPHAFFQENYVTEGMSTLLEQGFKRLDGKNEVGIFLLKQAMGGGKTHNLLTFGLLARNPGVRDQALVGMPFQPSRSLGPVKVVAFSGRHDAPLGIWGAIAEGLGKKDHFKDYYSPLQAPGQQAWESLLDGETALILLDELPPYFDNAESKAIGNSNLARVTQTALANLFVALERPGSRKVCLVLTDLNATAYANAGQFMRDALHNTKQEAGRLAMALEPVKLNSDELYRILRVRLFEELPSEALRLEVAQAYAAALRDAKKMGLTDEHPEAFAERVIKSYPFHPLLRDLYGRFRENPGFQQTRGLIRLMRATVAELWNPANNAQGAQDRVLIAPYDVNLNDDATRTEIAQINSNLQNAVAHDIASGGSAVAEELDLREGNRTATDAAKLLLMASLANVQNPTLGLSIPDATAALAAPGRDITRVKAILEDLATRAWYMHGTDAKLYFKNVKNINAELDDQMRTLSEEHALQELRTRLESMFEVKAGYVYGRVAALPAVDALDIREDRPLLVIFRPHEAGLHPDLRAVYEATPWKNRVAFLTGSKGTYQSLVIAGKRLRAIQGILGTLEAERTPPNDPQMLQARDLADKAAAQFQMAVRETFTTLHYPTKDGLSTADFRMEFSGNKYEGEKQVEAALRERQKFTDEVSGETFRKKVESRLFTQQTLPWSEIKKRAASNSQWQWHKPDALDALRGDMLSRDQWREEGNYINKGPFAQPDTDVTVQQLSRDPDSGEVRLRVVPVHGTTIYWDEGGDATPASARLEGSELSTKALNISFLCVDDTGDHQSGPARSWHNSLTLKYRSPYQVGADRRLQLQVAPHATIRYTTDGSNPRAHGAVYSGEFVTVPQGTAKVLVIAERDGVYSEQLDIPMRWDKAWTVEAGKPARWSKAVQSSTTAETFTYLDRLKKYSAQVVAPRITVVDGGAFVELQTSEDRQMSGEDLSAAVEYLRGLLSSGAVQVLGDATQFARGQDLLDWAQDAKQDISEHEVSQ